MADLNTEMQTLSEDVFAQLMGEVPNKTVTPENLIGSTKTEEKKDSSKKESQQTSKKEGKEEVKEEVKEKQLSQEEIDQQLNTALDLEDEEDEEGDNKSSKKTEVDKDTTSSILQSQAQYLIEKGIWKEFEGMEDFEWNNENYETLVEQQAMWGAEDMFSELLDSTGPYGQAIISHVRNGGNPDEIIDLFKEAKKIESFDIKTEEGKIALLTKYYKDLGYPDKRVKRTVDAIVDSGSLDEEAEDARLEMEASIKEEVELKQKQQEQYLAKQKEAEEAFANNITGALKDRKDITNEQKRDIYNSLLVYDKKLENGKIVNQFTLDFAKLQSDPKKYIDLVLFVKDYDKYVETLAKKEEKKAVKKTWEFIKGNGAASKSTGAGGHTKSVSKDKSDLVIDYRSLIN